MRIYTRGGDGGETSLLGRVSKDSPRVETCGDVDELNSFIGLSRSFIKDKEIDGILREVQKDLYILSANLLSSPPPSSDVKPLQHITPDHVKRLEDTIDKIGLELAPLRKFVVPGGGVESSLLHVTRAVCRRAERRLVSLSKREDNIDENLIPFMNRLSDLLFVLARLANKRGGFGETVYQTE